MRNASIGVSGSLALKVIRSAPSPWPAHELTPREILRYGTPQRDCTDEVNLWRTRNLPNLWRGVRRVLLAKHLRLAHHFGALYLSVTRADGSVVDLGLASMRVITDTGVAFIVDAFQNTTELENLKFHGFGTGTTAEAASQTALVTELTTEYATDNTRPTGSTTEGATANIYRTVGTLDPDSAVAITEHGIFSQAATGGGTMFDRSVFAAVNLAASGDTLQATYDATFTSGS